MKRVGLIARDTANLRRDAPLPAANHGRQEGCLRRRLLPCALRCCEKGFVEEPEDDITALLADRGLEWFVDIRLGCLLLLLPTGFVLSESPRSYAPRNPCLSIDEYGPSRSGIIDHEQCVSCNILTGFFFFAK